MSRWLSSVNNLLEKLDDKAETVAEERWAGDEGGQDGIDDILAKRGLEVFEPEETFEEGHGNDDDDDDGEEEKEGTIDIEMQPPEQDHQYQQQQQQQQLKVDANNPTMADTTAAVDGNDSSHSQPETSTVDTTEKSAGTENSTRQEEATASTSDVIKTSRQVQSNSRVKANNEKTKCGGSY